MVATLAPSDIGLRPVDFESITNNTIILHESPVSSNINDWPNLGPMNSSVWQLQKKIWPFWLSEPFFSTIKFQFEELDSSIEYL